MRKAFTLVELLVVVGILVAIGAIVFANYSGRKTNTDLISTTQQVATLLRQAQSDSITQDGGVSWGVHFDNTTTISPFYVIFAGTYTPGNTKGYYPLPATVAYQTSSIPLGSSVNITFSQITGFPVSSTSIGFYMPFQPASFSSTISIASTGAIIY